MTSDTLVERSEELSEVRGQVIEIEVIVGKEILQRAKVRKAIGLITAEQLHARFKVPHLDPVSKVGYQRQPQLIRVNRLASDLAQIHADLPTALLMNLRVRDTDSRLIAKDGKTYLRLLPEDRLYVVDGQHRVLAVDKLLLESPERWADLEIPFVVMLGADEFVEMDEFYIVNSTAKSVSTDLAMDLLKQRAEADGRLMERLDETGRSWMVKGQGLAERLNGTGVWKDRIQLASTAKAETTISSSGMINSLRPLLALTYFGDTITEDNQVKVLDAFWKGVQRVLPECFESPAEYSLQKSVGVQTMHLVLVTVLEYLRTVGQPVTDPASYEGVLKSTLERLQGDDREGNPVSGTDFWKVGAEGAAGAFTSNAGRRVLVSRIRSGLPKVTALS